MPDRPSEDPGYARLARPAERAARARLRLEQTPLTAFVSADDQARCLDCGRRYSTWVNSECPRCWARRADR